MHVTANPVDSLVGARIRLLRKRRKMSQGALGEAVGVTFQQIQKYENGKNRVGASRLHLIAKVLSVPIAELFDGTSETSSALGTTKSLAFDAQALRIAEAFVKISDKELRSSLVGSDGAEIRPPSAENLNREPVGARLGRAFEVYSTRLASWGHKWSILSLNV